MSHTLLSPVINVSNNSLIDSSKALLHSKILKMVNKMDVDSCLEFCKQVGADNIQEYISSLQINDVDIREKEIRRKDKHLKKVIKKFNELRQNQLDCDFLYQ